MGMASAASGCGVYGTINRVMLDGFIADVIEPGSSVQTGGLEAYRELQGYVHDR